MTDDPEHVRDAPAAAPVPPADIGARVTGSEDPDWYDRSGRLHLALFERALATIGRELGEFGDIYDFGCGPGRILRHVAAAAPHARLHGSDIEAPGVEWLREQLPAADLHVNQGLPPLPLAAGTADLVLSWSVFTHLPEGHQFAWLHELARVARPGAILLLTVHGEANWRHHVEATPMAETPDLDAIAAERARTGFARWEGGIAPGFPDFYRTTFHTPGYVRREWSRWFRVLDVMEAPGEADPVQDVAVLQVPGAIGGMARRMRRAPAGVARRVRARRAARARGRVASVVLPVKNAGPGLGDLLRALRGQRWDGTIELVGVDSGSEDQTRALLDEFGVSVVDLDPAEFGHGRARNAGAARASGDVIAFVTQSMRPVGERWLEGLVRALDADPRLAGVSGRLVAPEWADPLVRRDVERDPAFAAESSVRRIDSRDACGRLGDQELARLLAFTTVSCAIRPEVLERLPFPDVRTIGEDLLWARQVLEAGYAIGHAAESVATHAHAYSFDELFGRDFDDGVARAQAQGRSLDGETLLASIGEAVSADRRYLADSCGLAGAELELWTREAVRRRTAQLVGQWLGNSHERLPPQAVEALSLTRRVVRGGG